jgi:hypothetical protein
VLPNVKVTKIQKTGVRKPLRISGLDGVSVRSWAGMRRVCGVNGGYLVAIKGKRRLGRRLDANFNDPIVA